MRTSSSTQSSRSASTHVRWATWLLFAVGAAGCSDDALGRGSPRDAAAGGSTGLGGVMGGGGAKGTGGTPGTGETTGSGGGIGVGGSKGEGGASGVVKATGGTFVSALDGSAGVGGTDGSRASGGVVGSGGAAAGEKGSGGVRGTGGSAADGDAADGSIPDGGVDAAADTPLRPDTHSADLPLGVAFDSLIGGTWLVGWAGGARHYSWVRLSGSGSGTAEFLSGADLLSNIPFWDCDGEGSWFASEGPYSIMLRFPSSCPSGTSGFFAFQGLPDGTPFMPGATFGMVAPSVGSNQPMTQWWKFPDDQCDEAMSSCKSPF